MDEHNPAKWDRLVLTFALSPKGMVHATEIDPKFKDGTNATLLAIRDDALRAEVIRRFQERFAAFKKASK